MLNLCLIELPDGSGRVVKARQQISPDIADFGGIPVQRIKNVLDMCFVQPAETSLDNAQRKIFLANADSGLGRSQDIGYQVGNALDILGSIFLHKLIFRSLNFGAGERADFQPVVLSLLW